MVEWTYHGPLGNAFDFALTKAKTYDYRYLVRRRKIGGVYLQDLDGTPVWDIVRIIDDI